MDTPTAHDHFNPYLVLGGGVAFLYGEALIRAYLAWSG